ncbi:hypothetical protein BKA70DRAFT_1214178 [Coprinopsis sp. MPI-PUGE-AT-0042]|nr:hypothetical protein BKA70DRAFT_1214178 [Coprinopsis sp. MPI-PUGE-AT-0042]
MPKDTTQTPDHRLRRRHRPTIEDRGAAVETTPGLNRVPKEEGGDKGHSSGNERTTWNSETPNSSSGPELASGATSSTSRARTNTLRPTRFILSRDASPADLNVDAEIDKEQVLARAAERMKTKLEEARQQVAELQQELEEKDEALRKSQEDEVQYRNWWLNEVQFTQAPAEQGSQS